MRSLFTRLVAIAVAVVVVVSCDTRLTQPVIGGGGGGGGTGSGGSVVDSQAPRLRYVDSLTDRSVRPEAPLNVEVHVADNVGVTSITMEGYAIVGDPVKGTARRVQVFAPQSWAAGDLNFPTQNQNFDFPRILSPVTPFDTAVRNVVIVTRASDAAGNVDSVTRTLGVTYAPRVVFVSPASGFQPVQGGRIPVQIVAATSTALADVILTVTGASSDTTVTKVSGGVLVDTLNATISVKQAAVVGSKITLKAVAHTVDSADSTTLVFTVQAPPNGPPLVHIAVPQRVELTDSVLVRFNGLRVNAAGLIVADAMGDTVRTPVKSFAASTGPDSTYILLSSIPLTWQGRAISIIGLATDDQGRTGYSVPDNVSLADTVLSRENAVLSLIVFGRTYALPRAGTAGDVIADAYGNIYVSNTSYNRLELLRSGATAFDPNGVAVGSEPWGMAISTDGTQLLVANSGGTNISRIGITNPLPATVKEDPTLRLRTRNTYAYVLEQKRDETTNKITLSATGPYSYSDRPQYIAQSKAGRIFYSTRPTVQNKAGTIGWLDPSLPVPDPRQIWQYGDQSGSVVMGQVPVSTSDTRVPAGTFVLFDVDSVFIYRASANTNESDEVVIYDHKYGSALASDLVVATDSVLFRAVANIVAGGGDAELVQGLDINSLALTDTTFVAASGDRSWIAFGEGNTGGGVGRAMMVNDGVVGSKFPGYFSPKVTISDILDNAAEPVFGLALDTLGNLLAVHGQQSYFASVDVPFHLRLQGKYDSFDKGAGIAFHPSYDAANPSNPDTRVAFVASANGTIDIVDPVYYVSRGSLPTKGNLTGTLRAELPTAAEAAASDPANPLVVKLYAMSAGGLVVVNVYKNDIKSFP